MDSDAMDYETEQPDCQPDNGKVVYDWKQPLHSLRFPVHCRLCAVRTGTAASLCPDCATDLPWLESACRQCGCALPAGDNRLSCGACQQQPPYFDATTAILQYRPPVDYLVQRLKFSGELAIAPLLSGLLATRLRARQAVFPGLVVPVPLHPSRLRVRGFNQATELARHLGRLLGIAVDTRLCRRTRNTEPQSLLPVKLRRHNLRDAFRVDGTPYARDIAIVDDVMTTGHTAGELARALKRAGAERVEVWVIARAGN
jgi:ComF family protein